MKPERLPQLDGLRGLASLAVVLAHVDSALVRPPWLERLDGTLLHILWDGYAAVLLFFVLSGYVLALPYLGGPEQALHYPRFLARRILRIYPAYWAALLLALALRAWVFQPEGLEPYSPWAREFWHQEVGAGQLLRHAAMVLPHVEHKLIDPVIWSLVLEMKVSVLFPGVLLLLRWAQARRAWPVALGLLGLLTALGWARDIDPLRMLPLFVLGALLAQGRAQVADAWARLSLAGRGALGLGAVLLYGARFVWPGVSGYPALAVYLPALGSGLAIVLALHAPGLSRLLSAPGPAWLGASSYSLYLVHLPLLLALSSRLQPTLGSPVGALLGAAGLSLGVGWALWRAVERPGQRLGRALGAAPG